MSSSSSNSTGLCHPTNNGLWAPLFTRVVSKATRSFFLITLAGEGESYENACRLLVYVDRTCPHRFVSSNTDADGCRFDRRSQTGLRVGVGAARLENSQPEAFS